MSIRHLDHLFTPRSVAVIGASPRPGNLGGIVLRNLLQGGFAGPVWAVGREAGEVAGVQVLAGIDALPAAPDLAVVCTPAATVPGVIADLGRKGTRAAVVITAGLKQPMPDGDRSIEQAMLDAARPHLLRILGPNCIGELVPGARLNASFAPADARPGRLAFVTQSGALATAMLDWANGQGIGFSHFISLGDGADVDFGDVLDYLAVEPGTGAILMYMESVRHARKFMSAARAAARNKPVIVVKAGRAPEGARAAASHTGALAGSDAVFDAAVRRAGMLRVDTLEGLFDAAQTLSRLARWSGERLAIVTNGGGAGVLAADALSLHGGQLAQLAPPAMRALDACLPPGWSHGNPVDIVGDAPVQRYVDALRAVLASPDVDGVLFMHAPTAIVPALAIAQACLPLLRESAKPVLSCWLGGPAVQAAQASFSSAGLPCYASPERAVDAWMQLVHYHRNQAALLQLPSASPLPVEPDRAAARRALDAALAAGQEWLDPAQAMDVLHAYGIPAIPTRKVRTADEAAAAAASLGFPVALKIVAAGLVHKSEAGGVALGLASQDAVRDACGRMLQRVAQAAPQAQAQGFIVQPMAVRRRDGHELIVGIAGDPVFGPVVLFGAGGTGVEVTKDTAMDLPPIDTALAASLVARTRVAALLAGYRDRPAVDRQALLDAIVRVSQIACDLPELAELDVNPLVADADGVLALDARIRVRRPQSVHAPLALRPYPAELEGGLDVDGHHLLVRPIRPEDGGLLADFYAAADPRSLRLRFFHARREVPRSELARYCQIDYDREMAFIAVEGGRMVGEVRAQCDPDNEKAEFAIHVAQDWQRRGLGRHLLQRLVDYLRARGTRDLVGECLEENFAMAALARGMGFAVRPAPEGLFALHLPLAPAR